MNSWFTKDEKSTERVTLGPSQGPGPHHSTSVDPSRHFRRAPLTSGSRWWHEEPALRAHGFQIQSTQTQGPTQIRSCVAGDRYPEPRLFQGRNSPPMVSFIRTHYRILLRHFFAGGAYRQEGPTGQSVEIHTQNN